MDMPVNELQIYWKKNSKIIAMHQYGCAAQIGYLSVTTKRQHALDIPFITKGRLYFEKQKKTDWHYHCHFNSFTFNDSDSVGVGVLQFKA